MDRLTVHSPSGAFLFELAEGDVFGRVRVEELNGEHSLTLTTSRVLEKEQRILTKDATGKRREWVVQGVDADHSSGLAMVGTYYCIWSLQHDLSLCVTTAMPGVQSPVSAAVALAAALEPTSRWTVGTVTQAKNAGASFYYMSSWEALGALTERWGGEVDATVEVDDRTGAVTARKVDLYAAMGDQAAKRRFDWGGDLTGIRRTVSDEPFPCRIVPRGKGEETDTGGYGRKIDITSVNGGKNYLQNDETAPLVRLPTPSGGWEYPTVVVENGECETPEALKAWALDALEGFTTPKVTYEATVAQLAEAGMDVKGVQLGDAVQCVDRGFSEEGVRVQGRVVRVEADELGGGVSLTLGYLAEGIASKFGSLDAKLSQVAGAVQIMNGGTMSTAGYLNRLLERVNAEINATGGYTYVTEGEGIKTYDKAVTDPLVGAEATRVVEIKGGSIRIADSKTSGGAWNWRTVFESGKIASDLLTASNIVTGTIRSAASGDYWNLDTGDFRLAGVPAKSSVVQSVDLEYAANSSASTPPSSGWGPKATVWKRGQYLWVREKMTMGDGTTSYSTGRLLSNAKGIGASGAYAEYYLSTSSARTQGGSWSAQKQPYKAGRFYFTRTRIVWSDGTVTYDPSVSGKLASGETANGKAAADALKLHNPVDIFNELTDYGRVQLMYRDSKTGQLFVNAEYIATGILADAKANPDAGTGNYWNLRTGELQMLAIDQLAEKVGDMKVGGSNLLDGTRQWAGWWKEGGATLKDPTATLPAKGAKVAGAGSPINARVTYQRIRSKEITVSYDCYASASWGKVSVDNSLRCVLRLCNDANKQQRWKTWWMEAPTTGWKRYSFTANVTDALFTGGDAAISNALKVGLAFYNWSSKAVHIRNVKVEVGNVATEWCESPYDAAADATAKADKVSGQVKELRSDTQKWTDNIAKALSTYTDQQKKDLADATTKAAIAKTLFKGAKGIRMDKGELYINASYIDSGTIDARVVRGGVIVPVSRKSGYFKIDLDRGLIESENMKATNVNVKGGSVQVLSGAYSLQLQGARLSGYRNGTRMGYIDPSGKMDYYGSKSKKRYATYHGLSIVGDQFLAIKSPRLAVSRKGDTYDAAFTGAVKLANICFGMNKNMTSCSRNGGVVFNFVNGIFTGVDYITDGMGSATKQEYENK